MSEITEVRGAFDSVEYARRVSRIRDLMRERDLAALFVTTPENIYYLIGLSHQGYFAFTALILPLEGAPVLLTRAMESATISSQAPEVEHVGYLEGDDAGAAAVQALSKADCTAGRIGVDTTSMFFPPGVWEEMESRLPRVEWFDTSRSASTEESFRAGLVDLVRLVKSDTEIAYMRQAAAVSDRAVRAGLAVAGVGTNEREVAAAVYKQMVLGGGEYPGFVPLIRSTDTLLEEHSTWRDYVLVSGDAILLELSGAMARYHAPLTRMAYLAKAPPGTERSHRIAVEALDAVAAALRPGVRTGEVYETWQQVVDEGLGHSRLRRHHCGYNVGIGFPPSWVGSSTVLGIRPGGRVAVEAGMAFHVLSWITDADLGDYFVSDTAVVTPNGAELLTTTPRNLVLE